MALLLRRGWTFEIEGRDYTSNLAFFAILIVLMAALSAWTGKWDSYQYFVGYAACFFGMLVWPLVVMSGLRRRQDHLLNKIRADYILATTQLMQGPEEAAREALIRIRTREAQWQLGAQPVIRYAHVGWAVITNLFIAFPGQVFHCHLNSHRNLSSLGETVRYMLETPSVLATTFGVALFFILFVLPDASACAGKAGRNSTATRWKRPSRPGAGSSRRLTTMCRRTLSGPPLALSSGGSSNRPAFATVIQYRGDGSFMIAAQNTGHLPRLPRAK